MEITFELCTIENFLLGIDGSDCIAENIDTGEQHETKCLSLGFLFFIIHLNFKPNNQP
jgi:hypothetical protein